MTSDAAALLVLLEGTVIGRLARTRSGLRLVYDDAYLDDFNATPLSVALAPPVREHADGVVRPWLWGLLPDSDSILSRWGRELGVSASSPELLLGTRVGLDCAGAVQFCTPDRLGDLLARGGDVEPLDDHAIAERLRELRADGATWLGPGFTGQFSLAGAQAKTALSFDEVHGWGQPHGSAPTTHILKPGVDGLAGHALNEHLCLAAAQRCGLRAARTSIARFEDEVALVVERFDRRTVDGTLVRLHQEDLCQAMAVHPDRKYQADGGPGPADVARLLRAVLPDTDQAVEEFVDALIFNWVIAGTDAHAKNYALLHVGQRTRLAPLYDIASALPYDTSKGHRLTLAMKVGRDYKLHAADRASSWQRLADDVGLGHEVVAARINELVPQIADAFAQEAVSPAVASLRSELPERLATLVAGRARECVRVAAS